MTTPATGTAQTAPTAPTTKTTADATGFDKDMFMKLLVAQLKYQNPDSPTDTSQYMQQMAVFAQVEKLGQLVDSMTAQQATQQRLQAEALVGMQITGTAPDKDGGTSTQITGVVKSVSLDGAAPVLTLADGSTVELSTVTQVQQAPADAPDLTAPGTTSTTV